MKKYALLLCLTLALVLASAASAVVRTNTVGDGGGSGCVYNGVTYAPGSVYPGWQGAGYYLWLGHPYSSLYFFDAYWYQPTCMFSYYYGYPGWAHG